MLKQKTAEMVKSLREESNNKGRYLTIRPGYTNMWSQVVSHVSKPTGGYADMPYLLEELNKKNETLDGFAGSAIELLSRSLSSSIDLYRNTVIGEIKTYCTEVKELVDAWSKSIPDSDITITYLDVPNVLISNPDLFSLREGMENGPVKVDESGYQIPGLSGDATYPVVADDVAPSDSDLMLWLAEIGQAAFASYFDNIYRGTALPRDLARLEFNIQGKLNKSMVAILSAKALKASPPENIAMSLNAYNATLTRVINYYSYVLGTAFKTLNGYKATNTLIIKEDKEKREAVIFQPVFSEWVEAEGTFEVLLGKILSRDTHTTVTGINKNLLKYANAWKSYNDLVLLRKNKERSTVIRRILKSTHAKGLNNPTGSEITFREQNPNVSIQCMQDDAECMIDNLTELELASLNNTCMSIITKIRFGHTTAYEFLSSMAASSKADKTADIERAVLSASINEMSRFIADSLMEVKG